MKRILILAAALFIAAVSLAPVHTEHAIAAPFGAATNMSPYNVTCNSASLSWSPSGYGQQQWVDLSHWNGFYWQWDEGGPLGGYTNAFQLSSLIQGTTYYVRIDTGTYDGYWLASDWVRFDTPNCGLPPAAAFHCPGGPSNKGGALCVNKGDGGTYALNSTVTICYDVSMPMYVSVKSYKPDGSSSILVQGFDNGTGDCLSGTAGLPTGKREVYLYTQAGTQIGGTWYFVVP